MTNEDNSAGTRMSAINALKEVLKRRLPPGIHVLGLRQAEGGDRPGRMEVALSVAATDDVHHARGISVDALVRLCAELKLPLSEATIIPDVFDYGSGAAVLRAPQWDASHLFPEGVWGLSPTMAHVLVLLHNGWSCVVPPCGVNADISPQGGSAHVLCVKRSCLDALVDAGHLTATKVDVGGTSHDHYHPTWG
jgi:hypothetical protein